MPKAQRTAIPTAAAKPKSHRSARGASRKPAALAQPPVLEFDATAHHEEIAKEAYLIWIGRAGDTGSPEEDWRKAEIAVRARYR